MEVKSILTVPNILLSSYVILGVISGFGVILASCDFGYGPVAEEPKTTINPSTFNYTEDFYLTEEYQMHMDYVYSTETYGVHRYFPSFYIILPCGVAFIFTGIFVLIEVIKKNLLKSTAGLYSSFGIFSMICGFMIVYQNQWVPTGYEKFKWSYGWVTAIHSSMIILLVLQMILSIWEMRRQKVSWPTLHLSHFFTIGMFVRGTLLILTVFTIIAFLISTMDGTRDAYDTPVQRFPSYYFMPCAVACLYGVLVTFEAYTSQIFGHIHNQMMGVSGLMMVIGYMVMAVISLPAVSDPVTVGHDRLAIVFGYSSACLCTGLIYSILCLTVPEFLNSPPGMIRFLAYSLSLKKSLKEGCSTFWKNLKESDTLGGNLLLVLLSFVCMILMANEWYDELAIMLCPDIAILYRTLSASITELSTQVPPSVPPVQRVFLVFLENVPLIIGIIYGIIHMSFNPIGCIIAAIVINCIIVIFQFYKVQKNPDVKTQIIEMDNDKENRRTKEEQPDEVPLNDEVEKTDEEEGKKNEETEAPSVYPTLSVESCS